MRTAVIGAGIVGSTVAHDLLDEGQQVTIMDRGGLAAGASRGNAGWIAHVDVLPLASPKAWRQVPRWLLDPLGPLAIRPAYVPRLAPWLLRFVAASRPERVRASMKAITALNLIALPAWEARLRSLGLEHHLRRRGFLSVWSDLSEFAAAAPVIAHQRAHGMPVETLAAEEVRRLEPALGCAIVAGALYETGCHVSDPRDLTVAIGEAALARGASLRQVPVTVLQSGRDGVRVTAADGSSELFDRAVIAAGAWSAPLAAGAGDAFPLDTERGYNTTLPSGSLGLTRPILFEGHGFVSTPLDTGDRVGGAVEFGGLEATPNYARVDAILHRLKRLVPGARVEGGERWMGFRPSMPDSLPVIGLSRRDARVAYAFGHGHYGLTQAAATAQIVAALLAGRDPALDVAPFSPNRF